MEPLKHECGVAMIRLLKPLSYYQQKYGTWMYALNKLYLLMEKQHNRGQEGAGVGCINLNADPGNEYMFREKALGSTAITEIYSRFSQKFKAYSPEQLNDVDFVEKNVPFAGQIYMGHLRYSTTGKVGLSFIHPFLRRNNWRARNLCLCGNFNMTNVGEIFDKIREQGQHPRVFSDTYILLEQIGHRLDRESERNYHDAQQLGLTGKAITEYIENHMDMRNVLKTSSPAWDGGYVVCGMTGSGEMFSMRDPWGIRPAFWYKDDEVVIVTSERPVIQTAFELEVDQVNELQPGQALLVNKDGEMSLSQILEPKEEQACSFERVYFSRGSDRDIYRERKELGYQLKDRIMKAIDGDVENTVFSFIPNTAEVAFYGMSDAFKDELNKKKVRAIEALDHVPSHDELVKIMSSRVRCEKVALKDIKLRTFITEGNSRNDLAAHVYDITYGSLRPYVDNLVIIDDSIVRGTTLRESIIRILDRLHPKKIVIVSSSPQVRFPDYYGIDMPHMNEFIAFRTAIALLKDRGMEQVIMDVYEHCKEELKKPKEQMVNAAQAIYKPFTDEEISNKMVELLRSPGIETPIEIVYQTLDGLHTAIPNHKGDWYFSGNYPTPGGTKLVNEAYIAYIEEVYLKNNK